MSWENHLKIQENKLSGKLIPWIIMSMEKCLTGGKNGRIKYLEEKIQEINVVQPGACDFTIYTHDYSIGIKESRNVLNMYF